jgi:hypothetical protein
MKSIITAFLAVGVFYLILALTNNPADSKEMSQWKKLTLLLGSNNPAKLELVVYENGCFDIRQKNIYLLRCA